MYKLAIQLCLKHCCVVQTVKVCPLFCSLSIFSQFNITHAMHQSYFVYCFMQMTYCYFLSTANIPITTTLIENFGHKASYALISRIPDVHQKRDLFWAETHPPSKFRGNPFCRFCLILLTNQPTSQQTDSGNKGLKGMLGKTGGGHELLATSVTFKWSCVCCVCVSLPADGDVSELRALRGGARFKIRHVEVGERVVDEAVHGARLAEHVQVDEPRDEVWREGDHKGLRRKRDRQSEAIICHEHWQLKKIHHQIRKWLCILEAFEYCHDMYCFRNSK